MNKSIFFRLSVVLLLFSSCTSRTTPFNNKSYYCFLPKKQVRELRFSQDSIYTKILDQNRAVQNTGVSFFKIHDVIKKEQRYILCVEEWNREADGKSARHIGFSVLSMKPDSPRVLIETINQPSYKTLSECKQEALRNPGDNFELTMYSSDVFDLIKKYRKISDLDSATICLINQKTKQRLLKDQKKIERIAKNDFYLSGVRNEIQSSVLMELQINPIDYTNEEMINAMKKCAIDTK